MRPITWGLLALSCALLSTSVQARIKLTTLPERERVEIRLDHPSATLVEEERLVPLLAGANTIDFAWANTSINKDSIVLRVLEAPGKVNLLSVSYPPGENALVWNVSAEKAGSARIRISYRIGGLTRKYAYRALASQDESTLTLRQYLYIKNSANEDFGDAKVTLGLAPGFESEVGIAETREVKVATYKGVPIRKVYQVDPSKHGWLDRAKDQLRVPMHYELRNTPDGGLGKAPLPAGKVRIFQTTKSGGSAFTGEDRTGFVPRDDKLRLYLGVARDVVVKRKIMQRQRKRVGGNLYDYSVVIRYEVENFKDQTVALDIGEDLSALRREIGLRRHQPPQFDMGDQHSLGKPLAEESNATRLVYRTDLKPRGKDDKATKQVFKLHIVLRNEW